MCCGVGCVCVFDSVFTNSGSVPNGTNIVKKRDATSARVPNTDICYRTRITVLINARTNSKRKIRKLNTDLLNFSKISKLQPFRRDVDALLRPRMKRLLDFRLDLRHRGCHCLVHDVLVDVLQSGQKPLHEVSRTWRLEPKWQGSGGGGGGGVVVCGGGGGGGVVSVWGKGKEGGEGRSGGGGANGVLMICLCRYTIAGACIELGCQVTWEELDPGTPSRALMAGVNPGPVPVHTALPSFMPHAEAPNLHTRTSNTLSMNCNWERTMLRWTGWAMGNRLCTTTITTTGTTCATGTSITVSSNWGISVVRRKVWMMKNRLCDTTRNLHLHNQLNEISFG